MIAEPTIAFLFVLAQIAGIYIGFGALISASKSSEATSREAKSLAVIVYVGIMVLIGALLPLLLNQYGLTKDWSLRIGAVVFLLLAWILIFGTFSLTLEGIKKTPALATLMWVQEAIVQIPLVLILVGAFSQHAEAFYLTALVVSAFEAAQLLVGLVFAKPQLDEG